MYCTLHLEQLLEFFYLFVFRDCDVSRGLSAPHTDVNDVSDVKTLLHIRAFWNFTQLLFVRMTVQEKRSRSLLTLLSPVTGKGHLAGDS